MDYTKGKPEKDSASTLPRKGKGERRMSDLISRQDAIGAICKTSCEITPQRCAELTNNRYCLLCKSLKELPSAEPPYQYSEAYVEQIRGERDIMQDMVDNMAKRADRPTGEWEVCKDDDGIYGVCSICGRDADFSHYGIPYNFCPNCGAKMEGGDTE
jgi:hypothetical protein